MQSQLNDLLNKEMDRKDFLKHVAVGMVVLSGLGSALKIFSAKPTQNAGYGASVYGGTKPGNLVTSKQ